MMTDWLSEGLEQLRLFGTFWHYLWLLAGFHFLCDFSLQTDAMAVGKNLRLNKGGAVPWYYWLFAHAIIHGLAVSMVMNSILLGVLETAVHWLIDLAKCMGWTNIHIDQVLHIGCKVVWLLLWYFYPAVF